MDQMTNIREQQERLAKLHFELGGPFLGGCSVYGDWTKMN